MLASIWDDINREAESIIISDIKYNPTNLSNILYNIIDNRVKRRQYIKQNRHKSTHDSVKADFKAIQRHRDEITNDENITLLIKGLFKKECVECIEPLDRVFLNAYYRRLLRAKLEREMNGKKLVPGQVIIEYSEHETDASLVSTLRTLSLICKYLSIESTTHESTFSIEKLDHISLWKDVSSKFVGLFGETLINIIEDTIMTISDEVVVVANQTVIDNIKRNHQRKLVFKLLMIIFNTWSGSILTINADEVTVRIKDSAVDGTLSHVVVRVIPATYVTRMLPGLRQLTWFKQV